MVALEWSLIAMFGHVQPKRGFAAEELRTQVAFEWRFVAMGNHVAFPLVCGLEPTVTRLDQTFKRLFSSMNSHVHNHIALIRYLFATHFAATLLSSIGFGLWLVNQHVRLTGLFTSEQIIAHFTFKWLLAMHVQPVPDEASFVFE